MPEKIVRKTVALDKIFMLRFIFIGYECFLAGRQTWRWAVRLIAPEKAMVEVVWRWMVVGGDRRWDEMGVICR
eukprot:scaffold6802_cov144-Skeletonema_menzelii.AAC.7